jgi:hypothetical protein
MSPADMKANDEAATARKKESVQVPLEQLQAEKAARSAWNARQAELAAKPVGPMRAAENAKAAAPLQHLQKESLDEPGRFDGALSGERVIDCEILLRTLEKWAHRFRLHAGKCHRRSGPAGRNPQPPRHARAGRSLRSRKMIEAISLETGRTFAFASQADFDKAAL